MTGDVCACGLLLGDGHCTFDNPYPDERPHYRQPRRYRKPHRHSVWPKTNALSRKCGQRRLKQAVAREGGHAKRNPKLARERAIEKGALPSPHTLARRRFRLAGNCPAVPIMQGYRQGQAFSIWCGGQTEWRCGVR